MSQGWQLSQWVEGATLSAEEIRVKQKAVFDALLFESPYLTSPNFMSIHATDLERLFILYDRHFFDEQCRVRLGTSDLRFRVSSRMTRAGGKTFQYRPRTPPGGRFYEIAVSSSLLFQSFDTVDRTVQVTGLECENRLQALQRIFEHELVHLIEFLLWDVSQCSAQRFQSIALRFFGHTDHRHALVTAREHASTQFGVHVGNRVQFEFEGVAYEGVVNRITRRATVLVETPTGQRYSDGKRYAKFYIPVTMLKPV